MSRRITVLGSSLACAIVLSAGASGVFAAKAQAKAKAKAASPALVAYGTLSAISATSATVTTPANTTLTITLDPGAVYVARSQGAATGGLHAGEQVAVRGRSVNGNVTASSVAYNTTAFSIGAAELAGKVASTASGSITLTRANGQNATVTVNTTTKYFVNGKRVATAPALAPGQRIVVAAKRMTDGAFVALSVRTKSA
jgi:glucose/arabinose dehydrogenase